ncbi:MAG: helix-turn-helix domain-containing protein [Verrucomicrobiaceae bacterium]|nr:helix-turn-helix domain-containing protein [Verrucomicrobiaceae bacterium]
MNYIPSDKAYLTLPEVAPILRRSRRTIQRMVADRQLKAHKLRNRWVVKPECLEHFLKKLPSSF